MDWLQHIPNYWELVEGSSWAVGLDENLVMCTGQGFFVIQTWTIFAHSLCDLSSVSAIECVHLRWVCMWWWKITIAYHLSGRSLVSSSVDVPLRCFQRKWVGRYNRCLVLTPHPYQLTDTLLESTYDLPESSFGFGKPWYHPSLSSMSLYNSRFKIRVGVYLMPAWLQIGLVTDVTHSPVNFPVPWCLYCLDGCTILLRSKTTLCSPKMPYIINK